MIPTQEVDQLGAMDLAARLLAMAWMAWPGELEVPELLAIAGAWVEAECDG